MIDHLKYAQKISKNWGGAPQKIVYMLKHSSGGYLMFGKNHGRFSTRSAALNSLGRYIKQNLYWCLLHDQQDGLLSPDISHQELRDLAKSEYRKVRDAMLDSGKVKVVQK